MPGAEPPEAEKPGVDSQSTAGGRPRLNPSEARNRLLLRARDAMDRRFDSELDVKALAGSVGMSEAHFIRSFKETFAETPHRYLQRRRVERAMFLLRDTVAETQRSVTDVCFDVGFNSLGTFSRTFKEIVGISPTSYRDRSEQVAVPSCFISSWARPSSFGEAPFGGSHYSERTAAGSSGPDLEVTEETS